MNHEQYATSCLTCIALLLFIVLFGWLLCGCAEPAARYRPHQQYDRNGPCMNGNCPVINEPKQWLKPCP